MTSHCDIEAPSEAVFSRQLEEWLEGNSTKSVGSLGEVFAEKSFAVTILLLMFLPALPLPTGGITHFFEAITVIVAAEMVIGAHRLWLPKRVRERDLGPFLAERALPFVMRRIKWFERFARPRWPMLVSNPWFQRLLGVAFLGLAAGAAIAPPFSGLDTLPALGAVVIALGVILEDVLIVGIGMLIGTGGVVLIVSVGAALFRIVQHLF